MRQATSRATVMICTRDRGASVAATLESVLANTYPNFEVLLVDQSVNQDTEDTIARFRQDPHFRYIRTATQGKARALNLGLAQAEGEIVVLTDDDCTVPPNWLDVLTAIFARYPQVAVAFCNVVPGPHDSAAGFIPAYARQDSKLVRAMWQKFNARGIGAGMAIRRDAILAMGGFDECLGPGSVFLSCDDRDIPVRALLKGLWVYETPEAAVVHDGFRTWEQGKELSRRNWYGLGAAYAKPVRCGYWSVIPVVLYEAFAMALHEPLSSLLHFKRPRGFKRVLYFWRGFIHGLGTSVDCERIVYKVD